jgi:hypothetical protein
MRESADDGLAVFVLPVAGQVPTNRLYQKLIRPVVRRFRGTFVGANLRFQSLRSLQLVVKRELYESRGWGFSHALEYHFPGIHEPLQIVIAFELDRLEIGVVIHGAPFIVELMVIMD